MRIFVAARPDEEAVADLEGFLEPRRAALPEGWRWSASEQWHLTLAFAEDAEEWRVDDLVEHVAAAVSQREPGATSIAGGGAFPHPDGAKVLWAGLTGHDEDLAGLSAVTRQAASRAGVRVDGQRFRPHLTLARSPRPQQASDWVRLLDTYAGPDWPLAEVEVVASHLGEGPRGRPRHEVLATLSLGGSAPVRSPRRTPPSLAGIDDLDPGDVSWQRGLDGVRVTGADLSGETLRQVTLQETELVSLRADGARLEGCRVLDVRFDRLDAPDLVAADGTWRDCEVVGSRLGALSLHGAAVTALRLAGCKVDYLNLRGSTVTDLVVEDCAIGELDLAYAQVSRASFAGCTLGMLTLHGTALVDVDLRGARLGAVTAPAGLRGATVDHAQLLDLAPALAAELGIQVD